MVKTVRPQSTGPNGHGELDTSMNESAMAALTPGPLYAVFT